jgi:putative acetyltransferase
VADRDDIAAPLSGLVISPTDARDADVTALVQRHLAFAHVETPAENIHAIGPEGLVDPSITVFAARRDGVVVGIGALKELDHGHAELKSMHTASEARRRGVGRAMVERLLAEARARGYDRVSLETGSNDAFLPARALYQRAGFAYCAPFADYVVTEDNVYMTLELG